MPFVLHRTEIFGVIFGDEIANFLLEGDFGGAEFQLHHDSPKKLNVN
jgi:hypothetical protein